MSLRSMRRRWAVSRSRRWALPLCRYRGCAFMVGVCRARSAPEIAIRGVTVSNVASILIDRGAPTRPSADGRQWLLVGVLARGYRALGITTSSSAASVFVYGALLLLGLPFVTSHTRERQRGLTWCDATYHARATCCYGSSVGQQPEAAWAVFCTISSSVKTLRATEPSMLIGLACTCVLAVLLVTAKTIGVHHGSGEVLGQRIHSKFGLRALRG